MRGEEQGGGKGRGGGGRHPPPTHTQPPLCMYVCVAGALTHTPMHVRPLRRTADASPLATLGNGITLRGLRLLRARLELFFGAEAFADATTADVNTRFVRVVTAKLRCRLAELPDFVDPKDRGTPMYYISHAWCVVHDVIVRATPTQPPAGRPCGCGACLCGVEAGRAGLLVTWVGRQAGRQTVSGLPESAGVHRSSAEHRRLPITEGDVLQRSTPIMASLQGRCGTRLPWPPPFSKRPAPAGPAASAC